MKILTEQEKHIIIDKGTEMPHSGEYRDHSADGIYVCRQCNAPLYTSDSKFQSNCGWPSFDDAIPGKVLMQPDADNKRTEIVCKTCGGHLGHVFVGEQQTEKSVRHCVNSLSMLFIEKEKISDSITSQIPEVDVAYLGGGCFWCIEGPLAQVPGIIEIRSGYMGGKRPFPTYERVTTGVSGYIEIVQVFYEPKKLTYTQLLGYFFAIHDPRSYDQQGNDKGSQYRSAIFTTSEDQERIAQEVIRKLDTGDQPLVTQVRPAETFYLAEDYHQNFYANNPTKPYCQLVVQPKIEKIQKLLS